MSYLLDEGGSLLYAEGGSDVASRLASEGPAAALAPLLVNANRLASTVAGSHQSVTTVDVMFNRATILEGLDVVAGSVMFDRNAESLARLSVTIAEPTRVPVGFDDVLSPYGYELAVKRGVRYRDDSTELVALGVFPIQRSSVDGVSLLTSITAEDRSRLVRDARFEDDYSIAAGTNYATAIAALVAAGVASLEYLFVTTTHTTPLLTFAAQDDRWAAARQMAGSIGCELFFDGLGRLVLRAEPNLSTATPTLTIAEGADGTLVQIAVDLDRSEAYNRWIHSSSNASLGAQYRGVATDDDPASPTYYLGPFGRKPKFYASEFLASDAQCVASATADKARSIGVARGLAFGFITNPAVQAGDVVIVRRAALDLDDVFVIDTLTIPLGPEGYATATGRARQATS